MECKHRLKCLAFVAILLIVAGQTGCQYALDLRVVPGSHVDALGFELSDPDAGGSVVDVTELQVYRCADISDRGSNGYRPLAGNEVCAIGDTKYRGSAVGPRVTYGKTPDGFTDATPARRLDTPGCYVVLAYGRDQSGDTRTATVGFRVDADSIVAQMRDTDYEAVFSTALDN